MMLREWKVPIITVLSLIAFLIGVVLIHIYEVTYQSVATPIHLLWSCNCEGVCSAKTTPSPSTKNESTVLDDVPRRKFYDEQIITGVGRRGGEKMNISLMSAIEDLEQIYVMMTSENRYGDTVYCRYFDHQRIEIEPAFEAVVFPEYTANCMRRNGTKYISLSESSNGSYEYPVPIVDHTQNETTHYFSACLAPIYGVEPKWLLLAEFIEHHKIQGVTHFFIYVKEMDEYSRKLLDDYVRTGEAEVIVIPDRLERDEKLWQLIEVQECFIRARGYSHWVAMIDLDERLTMTEYNGTLVDYLRSISDPTIAEVSFRQRWILRDEKTPEKYIDEKQVAEMMPTWRFHNTSHVMPPAHTAKYVVDPKKVIVTRVHNVEKFVDGYRIHFVEPEEAVIRHYRDIHADNWKEVWLNYFEKMGEFSMTDYPEGVLKTLRKNIQRRLQHVYGGRV